MTTAARRKPQQVTRMPRIRGIQIRPGDWIKLRGTPDGDPHSLAGKIVQVRSLACCVTAQDTGPARWRLCLEGGRAVEAEQAERFADEREIEMAEKRRTR